MREHSGTDASAYKFTDQELDAETGLYNYDARLYDPLIGRFISADTIVPNYRNPQSLNRYRYCLNNPLIYTDPSGHAEIFRLHGVYIETTNPEDNNVYVRDNNQDISLDISVNDFHDIAATVFAEASPIGDVSENTGIAFSMQNRAENNGLSLHDVATNSAQYFGADSERSADYNNNWQHGGASQAPAARAGVINAILGTNNPIGNRTMFEGTALLNSEQSRFSELYIDTNVAYDPIEVGGTTYFMEGSASQAEAVTHGESASPIED